MVELTRAEFAREEFTRWDASIPDVVGRIVVLPDIHGDMSNFIRSIWIGLNRVDRIPISPHELETLFHRAVYRGEYPEKPISTDETTMIQLGDVIDRGPESLECLRVLWSIERVVQRQSRADVSGRLSIRENSRGCISRAWRAGTKLSK
jgi:hypothetical protein